MDLDGFTSFICTKIGMTDDSSVKACATYVQRRYQMIYDRRPWKDSLIRVTAGANANTDNVALPDGIDRVVSIRYGDHFLDPIDDTFFIETDPTIFERTGIPQFYQEYTEQTDNSKRIRLYPIPAVNGSMFVVGKRTLPPLINGSDTPILRNVDNVIAAYAMGDMLEKLRQNGKAQAKFAEATLLYAEAEKFETAQANVPRRTKQLSVNGNSLAEMADAVCARLGDYTPETQILAKEFIREEYRMIYDSCNWPETLTPFRADSDGTQVVLPDYIDRVISVRAETGGYQIYNEDVSSYFALSPHIFEQTTGPALAYSLLTPVGVATLPPLQERLAFTSSDPMDSANVLVRGESGGQIYEETIQLNGLSPVYTVRSYDTPLTISKPTTHGDVTVRGAFSNALLQTLFTIQTERKHMRLWIQPNSTTAHHCLILGKRRMSGLVSDSDTPMVRNLHNVLVNRAVASAAKDPTVAAKYYAKADAALKTLIDGETNQQSHNLRVIPDVELSPLSFNGEAWFLPKGALG